ncbi:hypothetical protein M409DRAFT_49996 [Zasmidium cellare ATCC 36951]|uniref:Uncharacterized protein n=1 Tax=Zasmidium cellare ATCC 36951 TaxID=1080233 RepID=A0A6A6CYL1_ZASCE|nr:uncharacterized protein M409DRAFT_49996 [Zasmidium cellare ATCC 36951]KAF2172274.1 hypothetical protein M409DRAFT_49996 [Zasmidium cellare ATCC 36951]
MSPLTLVLTLTTLLLTSASASAQDEGLISILPSYPPPPEPTCTTIITHPPGCCPALPAHTTTSYTACGPCALAITTAGPMCMMYCGTSTRTDPSKTTTITACAPSFTTSCTKDVPCTKTVTERNPFPCGDCGVGSVDVTTGVDCGGCGLATVTEEGGVGVCVCPTERVTRVVGVCVDAVVTGV